MAPHPSIIPLGLGVGEVWSHGQPFSEGGWGLPSTLSPFGSQLIRCGPPRPAPPPSPQGWSALAACRLSGAVPAAPFIFLSRGLVNMEPASGETGVCRVRDDKSQPNGQAESSNAHLHLIHQPSLASEPLPPQGRGLASRRPSGAANLRH